MTPVVLKTHRRGYSPVIGGPSAVTPLAMTVKLQRRLATSDDPRKGLALFSHPLGVNLRNVFITFKPS